MNNIKKIVIGLILVIFTGLGLWNIFTGSDEYSPEDINSILQNKDELIKIKKIELTAQNLKKPYIEPKNYKMKNWEVKGNTIIKNHDYVRLTSDNQHQVGSMFSNLPIQAESFEMELTFHIHSKNMMMADGMGIWFLDSKSEIGDVFGVKNYFNGLGIMIDTFKNGKRGQFPFINLMLGNGQLGYDKALDGYDTRLAGCVAHANILNPKDKSTKVRIVYLKNGYFSLDLQYKPDTWTNCVTLHDIKLPPIKYLGFSSETGQLSENVDIIENKIFGLFKPDGSPIEKIEELHNIIENQDIENQDKNDPNHKSNHKPRSKTRRSIKRLQKAEKRIKENTKRRNLEQYGHEDANIFTHIISKIWVFVKYLLLISVVAIAIWFSFIVFRVLRGNKKPKTTGLLD